MKRLLRGFSAALLLLASAGHVLAQSSIPKPLWEAGVFGGSVSQQAYPGANQQLQRNLVLPYLVYRGEWLRAGEGGVELRKMLAPDVELGVGFSATLGSKTDEIEVRHGMPEIGTLLEVGPRLRWTLGEPAPQSRLRAVLSLRTALDANDGFREKGLVLEPELVYEQRTDSGLQWSANAGLEFGDARLADFYYGVAPIYQTANRPAYVAKGGLITSRISVSVSKALTQDLRIGTGLRFDSVNGAANQDSPLVRQNNGATVGLWLTYTLARSQTMTRN